MTREDFEVKFLRIAGRSKEGGSRRSPRYRRRFTGAKGIGRLSAHKLGGSLRVESVPNNAVLGRKPKAAGFVASIDWQAIERSERSIESTREIAVVPVQTETVTTGTHFDITKLHVEWSTAQLNRFLREVRSTRPDVALTEPVRQSLFPGPHLLQKVKVSDSSKRDPGFTVELSGEFSGTEAQWPTLLSHTNWMIEINASRASVQYRMTPSVLTQRQNPSATTYDFSTDRRDSGPEFVARIFVRDGSTTGNKMPQLLDRFAKDASGVRIYSEGFRVLPYGSARNDWLGIDADYTRRARLGEDDDSFDGVSAPLEKPSSDERVYVRPGSSYFGGVFLLDASSHGLEMVVNREGYLPNQAFESMQAIVRRGVDLSVRVRASVGIATRELKERERKHEKRDLHDGLLAPKVGEPDGSRRTEQMTPSERLTNWVGAGRSAAASLRASMPVTTPQVDRALNVIAAAIEEVGDVADAARDEQSQIRVLASIGTQMGAFVHEINGVLGQARTIVDLLDQLIEEHPHIGADLRIARRAQWEMIAALERQAVYLSDSLDAEARRRRSKQIVQERVATAFRLLGPTAAARGVRLIDATDPGVRTLPMFPAEVNVILTNLISNAIRAASIPDIPDRVVLVSTIAGSDSVTMRVSNTGTAVDVVDSERWFRPFESTTSSVDAVLGQGLGLGLPLTRRIVEEYGGIVAFTEPESGMATTIDVSLPSR